MKVSESPLRILVRERPGLAVVELRGRLEGTLDRDLLREIEALNGRGITRVVVDCAGLDYLSSRGVSAFIAVIDDLRGSGGDLKLVGTSSQAGLVLDRLGVSKLIQSFGTVDAAVEAFATPIADFLTGGGLDQFVAASGGGVFHASGCKAVRRMRTVVPFASKKEAREAGLRPCRRCC